MMQCHQQNLDSSEDLPDLCVDLLHSLRQSCLAGLCHASIAQRQRPVARKAMNHVGSENEDTNGYKYPKNPKNRKLLRK
eukprot:s2924_g7.t1